jgi:DNA-binding MarR family transcriptional regulator
MRLLWAIEHRMERTSKRMDADMGVTGPQRLVLRMLERHPGSSAGALAAATHLHPSTLTGILQRLLDKRLIARVPDPADSRRVQLRARPRARAITRVTAGTVEAAVQAVLSRSRPSDVAGASRVLGSLAEALDRQATGD